MSLYLCVSACLSVTLTLNISELRN